MKEFLNYLTSVYNLNAISYVSPATIAPWVRAWNFFPHPRKGPEKVLKFKLKENTLLHCPASPSFEFRLSNIVILEEINRLLIIPYD